MNRKQVYMAIDSERDYQEQRWPGHQHEIESYVVYMEDYLNELKSLRSRNDGDECLPRSQDILRKVIALGVACAEQHGIRGRS